MNTYSNVEGGCMSIVDGILRVSDSSKDTSSRVDHPSHYNNGSIECIEAMLSAFTSDEVAAFCKLNAFKYIWRATSKGQIEDMEKAQWYLNKYLEIKKGSEN